MTTAPRKSRAPAHNARSTPAPWPTASAASGSTPGLPLPVVDNIATAPIGPQLPPSIEWQQSRTDLAADPVFAYAFAQHRRSRRRVWLLIAAAVVVALVIFGVIGAMSEQHHATGRAAYLQTVRPYFKATGPHAVPDRKLVVLGYLYGCTANGRRNANALAAFLDPTAQRVITAAAENNLCPGGVAR